LPEASAAALWPLALYVGLVVFTAAATLFISYVLGERHSERTTGQPYESGVPPTGSARLRFANEFYLIAIFFVIFDVESAFIFAWAVAARELGWRGYAALLVFVAILVAALVYLWAEGALDWVRTGRAGKSGPGESEAAEDANPRQ